MKKYDLVIENNPADLIKTTNAAIDLGYVPRGGVIEVSGTYMQSIYLRPKPQKKKK